MNKNRPKTTLFMLMSLDGKITTGDKDVLDTDSDFPKIRGVAKGLHQYYDLEKWTDLYSLNSGRVMAKIGMNKKRNDIEKLPVSFIIIDNKPHLTKTGINNLFKKCQKLYLVTTNRNHPAFRQKNKNLKIIAYSKKINFADLFEKLKRKYNIGKLTIQSGGTLNAIFLRKGLIDQISVVIAPCLIGGKDTSSLIDGESLHKPKDLFNIRALKLRKIAKLKDSYLHLMYDVVNKIN